MSANDSSDGNGATLRILHVLRAPVGGLFRHVADLARAQAARGHAVGIVADAQAGGAAADALLDELASVCALGVTRTAMPRQIGAPDVSAVRHVVARTDATRCDVIHGHGAKGGAYARLAGTLRRRGHPRPARVYTPHGGSLHYERASPQGFVFLNLERLMLPRTDAILFESRYAEATFERKVGARPAFSRIVHNGLREAEFVPVAAGRDACDFVFVGELRHLKGVDLLVQALAELGRNGVPATAAIVGAGPDEATFRSMAEGLGERVRFTGALPAREAFALGRCLVVPSRAESLPYVVLEAIAAGLPVIAARVGGIPEIIDDSEAHLVSPGDAQSLASAMSQFVAAPIPFRAAAARLRDAVHARFHVDAMTSDIIDVYRTALRAAARP